MQWTIRKWKNFKLHLKYHQKQNLRGKFSKICARPPHRKWKNIAERNLKSPKEMERYTIFIDWSAYQLLPIIVKLSPT